MYPDGWSRYALLARLDGAKPKSHLARFAARYRFAGQLNSIEVLGMSPATTDSYLATLRLALAYSALEALETEFKGQHKLQDQQPNRIKRRNRRPFAQPHQAQQRA